MARRVIIEEKPSRLAIWSRGLAFFALVVALLALVLVRGGFVEAVPGFVVLAGGLGVALIAILLAVGAFVAIWRDGVPGLGRALVGLVLGAGLIAYPAYLGARAYRLPPISDVSTDTVDPPRFEQIARLRARDANPVAYAGENLAVLQRAAYPEIVPLQLSATPDEAYNGALEVLNERKWRVVEARMPQAGRREGRIEAVARTTVMGFRDDVVVRIRALPGGSRIDIRSASRYGTRDFGTNARRVRSLLTDIEETIGAQPLASR